MKFLFTVEFDENTLRDAILVSSLIADYIRNLAGDVKVEVQEVVMNEA